MPYYSKNKDISKKIRLLIKAGWRYQRRKKHGILVSPTGARIVVAITPSCYRSYHNFCSRIRLVGETARAI